MEMTFPHFAARQNSAVRVGLDRMLATVLARQANSQTVRAMRRAEMAGQSEGDPAELRVHYFARRGPGNTKVRGAFWRNVMPKQSSERAVYQAGSTNIKVRELENDGTGEQFNHAGHGALRKL